MGRRNIFTYLGRDSEKVNNRIKKYMKFIEAHNDAPFEDRGEWIDCIDKIVYTDGNKSVSWLVFSSAGGDWATLEFFKDKFYGFYDRLKNLEQFEGYRTYNKKYYDIIKAFKDLTGVGALLNTSLNLHGLPIAMNYNDTIHVFENSDLDVVILDGCYLKKI